MCKGECVHSFSVSTLVCSSGATLCSKPVRNKGQSGKVIRGVRCVAGEEA
jgi:hypothetical protein